MDYPAATIGDIKIMLLGSVDDRRHRNFLFVFFLELPFEKTVIVAINGYVLVQDHLFVDGQLFENVCFNGWVNPTGRFAPAVLDLKLLRVFPIFVEYYEKSTLGDP